MDEQLGSLAATVDGAALALAERRAVERLHSRDHTLWGDDPTEIANRLGWLDEPAAMTSRADALRDFAVAARADGALRAVWCGMGGSSLFPQVLRDAFGVASDGLDVQVLDTSHPAAIARAVAAAPATETLWCFASKSGGTIETRCQLDAIWAHDPEPSRFVAVTDAGSLLDSLAAERGFRAVFHANPDVGGRFSAMTHFGLVPAALLGADIAGLAEGALQMAVACAEPDPEVNPALRLAAVLATAERTGTDKCTILVPAEMAAFGLWLEQLVAESTGKRSTGILPVVGEALGPPWVYGDDRFFVAYGNPPGLDALAAADRPVVRLGPLNTRDLGAEVFRWEAAVALACALMGVNPFDQPDVEAAKHATGEVLAGSAHEIPTTSVAGALGEVRPGDYVSIQVFCDPADPALTDLARSRTALRDRLRVAVTLDLGPRYLHSTGQMHKGGPDTGVFLQIVEAGTPDPPIPGRAHGFAALIAAQADGDYLALAHRGRRVSRVTLEDLLSAT